MRVIPGAARDDDDHRDRRDGAFATADPPGTRQGGRGPGPRFLPGWDRGRAATVAAAGAARRLLDSLQLSPASRARDNAATFAANVSSRRSGHRARVPTMQAELSPDLVSFARRLRTGARDRFVFVMDALARGASPPGMIDMTPFLRPSDGTSSQLRRRFTMIATFDQGARGVRRRPLAGLVLSVALGAVALTGAVRGQDDAAKADASEKSDVSAARQAAPAPPAGPKTARFTREDAEKLWRDKYADRIITVQGREANRKQVDEEYIREVLDVAGSEEAATAILPQAREQFTRAAQARKGAPERGRGRAAGPAADAGVSAEDAAMAALLARRVPELNFDGVALSDVVDFLRDVSNANLHVEWGALESAGVERATPVSVRVKDVAFSHALELVLNSAGGGRVPLDYGFRGGVIRISTGEDLDRITETRAYDVRDLVPAEIEMKELAALLKEAVNPDSWRDNGGSVGSVHTTKHKLIITTTESTHRGVRGILAMLRDEPRQARTEEAATAAQGPAGPRQ